MFRSIGTYPLAGRRPVLRLTLAVGLLGYALLATLLGQTPVARAAPLVRINFQPAAAPVPSGFLADTGAVYGDRGNGFTYGWEKDNSGWAFDRNSAASPDQAYDTLQFIGLGTMGGSSAKRWEIALSPAVYTVHIIAGDGSNAGGNISLQAENVTVVSGLLHGPQWYNGARTVAVTDGRLTITGTDRINFIEVTYFGPSVVRVNFQPAGAPVPSGYLADTGAIYGNRGNGFTYGWEKDNSGWAFDRNSAASPDQRYDTLEFIGLGTQGGSSAREWDMALPAAHYRVRIVAGDGARAGGTIHLQAGSVTIVNGPLNGPQWYDGSQVVFVDGILRIFGNDRICFVEVTFDSP